jgi:dihydropyrimidinase
MSRRRWVETPATTPARMFGLYPKKGVIAPGADADIVIYDPHAEQIVSAETHHMNVDYSAYEGKRSPAASRPSSRAANSSSPSGSTPGAGHGVYTPRSTSQYLN